MQDKIEIRCPECGKLITKIAPDSRVTVFGWCKVCKKERVIKYPKQSR